MWIKKDIAGVPTVAKGDRQCLEGAGSIPSPEQWVKDPALLQLWLKLQLRLRFDPWPRNFCKPWMQPKGEKRDRERKKMKLRKQVHV